MKTRIANQIFSEEQLLNAVTAYRERVRDEDPPDLKLLLKKQCFNQHCKLEHEALDKAKVILMSILLSDMEVLFEPPEPETAIDMNGEAHTFTETQTKILDILDSEVPLSVADVARELEVDHGFAESEITELFDKGFICRVTMADESDDTETVPKYQIGAKAAADTSETEGTSDTSEPEVVKPIANFDSDDTSETEEPTNENA